MVDMLRWDDVKPGDVLTVCERLRPHQPYRVLVESVELPEAVDNYRTHRWVKGPKLTKAGAPNKRGRTLHWLANHEITAITHTHTFTFQEV